MMKKFHISAGIISKNDGATYVKEVEKVEDHEEDVYFAIFEFLKGEDKYTWDNPLCNDDELEDSALVLARYHNTVYGLKPEGRRYEPRIIELLPTISGNLMKYAKRTGATKFDNYFLKNLDPILDVIDSTLGQIDRDEYEKLPRLAVHCDYHPGNLKYLNSRAVGLFDFDWSKIDARCFDVGLAITYFCTTWEGKDDGDMLLDRMIFFGERSLRKAVAQFLLHYHGERNHQGLDNMLIEPGEEVGHAEGDIQCRDRLGGLLRYYHRWAA